MMHFKEWIPATLRTLRGDMTLKELAEKAGVSLSYISDIETGRTVPTLETLDRLFQACGAVLTLGFEEDPFASKYITVKRADVEALRLMVDRLEDNSHD